MVDAIAPQIRSDLLDEIYRHARAEFPNECCGYMFGSGPSARLVKCKNRQDQLHALDPDANPRTSANAYNIGGRELLDLVRSFESDDPVTVIYHSHPIVGAYFSEEDANAAKAAGFPVSYLVVDAQVSAIGGAKLFIRADNEFIEVATFDGAPV